VAGASSLTLHWDGDTVLFVSDTSGNVVDFKIGLDGDITPRDPIFTGLTVYDRDVADGVIEASNALGHSTLSPVDPMSLSQSSGSQSATYPTVYSASLQPESPAVAIAFLRSDGFMWDGLQINGVRAYDPTLGSWTTPDAFEGDAHDPASQQKYMWNRGNPVDYGDPSGYNPALVLGVPVAAGAAADLVAYALIAAGAVAAGEELRAHGAELKKFGMEALRNSGETDAENPGDGRTGEDTNEHTNRARPSTEETHQKGQRRKQMDRAGEKADARRSGVPRVRPKGLKGPWPKKQQPAPQNGGSGGTSGG
jgi:RHS repeat-associated protein